ncbi:MAG: hypothetical protein Q4G48_10330, partial [Bacteroidia bacterium]|nr:hypothetical protein [Bacteroidia bacterium]
SNRFVMFTENQLRQQLLRKIEQLPPDKLRDVIDYIIFLENSVSEPAEKYIPLQEQGKTSDDFIDEVLYTPDEVFNELYNRLEKHYGVDLKTL